MYSDNLGQVKHCSLRSIVVVYIQEAFKPMTLIRDCTSALKSLRKVRDSAVKPDLVI
jgi:hypothetical protein